MKNKIVIYTRYSIKNQIFSQRRTFNEVFKLQFLDKTIRILANTETKHWVWNSSSSWLIPNTRPMSHTAHLSTLPFSAPKAEVRKLVWEESELVLQMLFQWHKSCWNDLWSRFRNIRVIAYKFQLWSINDSSLLIYIMDFAWSVSASSPKGGRVVCHSAYNNLLFLEIY